MSTKCISCGNSSDYQLHVVKEMMYGLREEFKYFECLNCGCLQIVNIPVNLEKYYLNNYYSFSEIYKSNDLSKKIRFFSMNELNRYSFFGTGILGRCINMKYNSPEGELLRKLGIRKDWSILDVGCGAGIWLFSLCKIGFNNLYGVDPFVSKDIDEGSVHIKRGKIYDITQKFDLIRSHHSFEHISDQYETLLKMKEILTSKGICIIAMPVKTEFIWKKYGTNWVQIDAPRHLIIHTVTSFKMLTQKAGFEVSDVIFNSTAFQFLGSEKYLKDIPLRSNKSHSVNPQNSIFSKKMISYYKQEAKRLNRESQGDQAIFVLKPLEEES